METSLINNNISGTTRILGDAFVETKLILDQIKTLTNDSLLLTKQSTEEAQKTANAQIKELLDKSDNTQSNSQIKDLVYDQDKNKTETSTTTNIASNLNVRGDINIISQNNNLISGSNLTANNINLTSTAGYTIITSAQDQSSKSTESTAQDYNDFSVNYNRGRTSADSTSNVLETTTTTNTIKKLQDFDQTNQSNLKVYVEAWKENATFEITTREGSTWFLLNGTQNLDAVELYEKGIA